MTHRVRQIVRRAEWRGGRIVSRRRRRRQNKSRRHHPPRPRLQQHSTNSGIITIKTAVRIWTETRCSKKSTTNIIIIKNTRSL